MFMVMDSHLKGKKAPKSNDRQALCATLNWSQGWAIWTVCSITLCAILYRSKCI